MLYIALVGLITTRGYPLARIVISTLTISYALYSTLIQPCSTEKGVKTNEYQKTLNKNRIHPAHPHLTRRPAFAQFAAGPSPG
jgi:hypothetical protein